ncbi:hypothetical protein [Nitrincola sp.]|uniref:hypothetical protein n=1 Tax=Nitrincola sp. TaxID=1926584 RepID=UPI003A8DC954
MLVKGAWCVQLIRGLILISLMLLSGCAGFSFTSSVEQHYQRGWVSVEDGQFYFRSCQRTAVIPVAAVPNELERLFNQRGVSAPLYVEWLGAFANGSSSHLRINEMRYVSADPSSCQKTLEGILLRAEGVAGWQADISEDKITVFLPQQRRTMVFPINYVIREGADWLWESDTEGRQRKHRLSLRVQPKVCQDTQSWFGLTVEMQLDGRVYTGCAKRGNLARIALFSRYQLSETVTTRDVRLNLSPEGAAALSEDYLNNQAALESKGHWKLLSGGRLLVTLDDPDPQLRQEALLFDIATDGGLYMRGFHPRYGHNGLRLHPAAGPMPWETGSRHRVP